MSEIHRRVPICSCWDITLLVKVIVVYALDIEISFLSGAEGVAPSAFATTSRGNRQLDLRKIDIHTTGFPKEIRQDVHANVRDDFDDVFIVVAGVARLLQFGGSDVAGVLDQRTGKPHGNGGLGILAATSAVGFNLGTAQASLAADGGMGGKAVFAGVLLGKRQRDALTRLWVE